VKDGDSLPLATKNPNVSALLTQAPANAAVLITPVSRSTLLREITSSDSVLLSTRKCILSTSKPAFDNDPRSNLLYNLLHFVCLQILSLQTRRERTNNIHRSPHLRRFYRRLDSSTVTSILQNTEHWRQFVHARPSRVEQFSWRGDWALASPRFLRKKLP